MFDIVDAWVSLGVWICQCFQHTRVLKMFLVLNMSVFWIYHGSEYARFTQGFEYAWLFLCLNLMMKMIMNCFCGMVDRRKEFSLISSRDHCQRSSPSRIFNMPRAGFELAQNLSSGLVEWNCVVVITTTPRCHLSEWLMFYIYPF